MEAKGSERVHLMQVQVFHKVYPDGGISIILILLVPRTHLWNSPIYGIDFITEHTYF